MQGKLVSPYKWITFFAVVYGWKTITHFLVSVCFIEPFYDVIYYGEWKGYLLSWILKNPGEHQKGEDLINISHQFSSL